MLLLSLSWEYWLFWTGLRCLCWSSLQSRARGLQSRWGFALHINDLDLISGIPYDALNNVQSDL